MQSFLYVSPANGGAGKKGGGPEDDPRYPQLGLRMQGFMVLAFGFALGLTFMIFFGIFALLNKMGSPIIVIKEFVETVQPNLWLSFIFGFIGGTLISVIYNALTIRRLNLFSLESSWD